MVTAVVTGAPASRGGRMAKRHLASEALGPVSLRLSPVCGGPGQRGRGLAAAPQMSSGSAIVPPPGDLGPTCPQHLPAGGWSL